MVSWFGTWMRRTEDFFLREGGCLGMEIKNLVRLLKYEMLFSIQLVAEQWWFSH